LNCCFVHLCNDQHVDWLLYNCVRSMQLELFLYKKMESAIKKVLGHAERAVGADDDGPQRERGEDEGTPRRRGRHERGGGDVPSQHLAVREGAAERGERGRVGASAASGDAADGAALSDLVREETGMQQTGLRGGLVGEEVGRALRVGQSRDVGRKQGFGILYIWSFALRSLYPCAAGRSTLPTESRPSALLHRITRRCLISTSSAPAVPATARKRTAIRTPSASRSANALLPSRSSTRSLT